MAFRAPALCAGRDAAFSCQVIEIGFNFHLAHLIGVALVIEEYELTDPIDVGLFRFGTEVLLATDNSDLFE
jgi:hypothetical protein